MDDEIKTNQQVVDEANGLARMFYAAMGCQVTEGYKFYEATHPQEVGCWNMAVLAYDFIEGTDVENALSDLDEDEETVTPPAVS